MTIEESTDPGQIGADDARADVFESVNTDFTPDQHRKMIDWAVEDGYMTREQANAALREQGLAPTSALMPEAEGDPAIAAEIDAGFPPAEPHQYHLPPLVENESDEIGSEQWELDKARRDWLSLARFPKGIGESIMKHVHAGVHAFQTLDDSAQELQQNAEFARVQKMFGDDAGRMVELAQQLVDEIEAKRPGLKHYLEFTGAGNNSAVVVQFAMQADRLYQRSKG